MPDSILLKRYTHAQRSASARRVSQLKNQLVADLDKYAGPDLLAAWENDKSKWRLNSDGSQTWLGDR